MDGKGQIVVREGDDPEKVWPNSKRVQQSWRLLPFEREISVTQRARSVTGMKIPLDVVGEVKARRVSAGSGCTMRPRPISAKRFVTVPSRSSACSAVANSWFHIDQSRSIDVNETDHLSV